jgi:hypothetical protein
VRTMLYVLPFFLALFFVDVLPFFLALFFVDGEGEHSSDEESVCCQCLFR